MAGVRDLKNMLDHTGSLPVSGVRTDDLGAEGMMARKKSKAAHLRFNLGTNVRVKLGVRDEDFPDLPLGGWSGTVKEAEEAKGKTTYLIAWGRTTLRSIHPIYKKRCERDGLEFETMWLGEEDLEADDGTPVPIEQPTKIKTARLSEKDQDDRVRLALGLTHDDPLPEVSNKTLRAYHRYLAANLKFPFRARFETENMSLKVTELLGLREYDLDVEEGLLCEARNHMGPFDAPLAELDDAAGNRKLVRDYGYWFWNYR